MTKTLALINGKVYTDWYSEPCEAIIINKGLVHSVGNQQDILTTLSTDTEIIDLNGKTVWPGLCDAHIHLEQLAYQLSAINCEGLSKEAILSEVKKRAANTPNGEWIIGYGFNQNDWQPPKYGTAKELDAVSPYHPVLIHARSLHAAWINSQAMQMAGIHPNSPDPEAGSFMRDPSGCPNGILLEYAISMVTKLIPEPSTEKLAQAIIKSQSYLHSLGITAVHDFDDIYLAKALFQLNEQNKLRLRITKNLRVDSLHQILSEDWREKLNLPPYISPGWLKLFADGALGPQSAAMLEPYENSQNLGMLLMTAEEMQEIGQKAGKKGWSLSIHAIGDMATRACLDAIESLQTKPASGEGRAFPHRIEHIQALHPQDLPRFHQLNVIASVQPVHATSDFKTATRFWGKRCETAYAYRSILESGAMLMLGTDAPVELPNPFHTIYAAVTRQSLKGEPQPDGWYPGQKLNMHDTLLAMTINPARFFNDKAQTGDLKPGSNADFIVFQDDPFVLPPSQLHMVQPEMTFVAGECVYSKV